MQVGYPEKAIEFFRAIADGELLALHTHQTWPENDQYVTMIFFSLMKIVEHRDSIQQIPK